MEQTHYVFSCLACHLCSPPRICLFHCLRGEALFYLSPPFSCSRQHCNFVLLRTPLPFISSNASSCASPHWLGSRAGWITMMVSVLSRVPVPPQSKVQHSPLFFFPLRLSSSPPFLLSCLLQIHFLIFCHPISYQPLLFCLFSHLRH